MRRRRPISVWPALADLMTVLAVVGLFLALSLLPAMKEKGDLLAQLTKAEQEVAELQATLASIEREIHENEERWAEERETLNSRLREAARNEKMFSAIQEAQQIVDEISKDDALQFASDQTLQFGDDLVSFDRNQYNPYWQPAGKEKLRRFCRELQDQFSKAKADGRDLRRLFVIQVEGHTDGTQCPGDPNCNWWLSGRRAAEFMSLMMDNEYCPGGVELQLRPVGYADSKPYSAVPDAPPVPTRRIALRIVPDYRQLLVSTPKE